MSENNEQDLVEEVTYTVEDAEVIPSPIDPTLSNPGEAADAEATGEAIASVASLVGSGTLPGQATNLYEAVNDLADEIGTGDMPGESATVKEALTYLANHIEDIVGDTALPEGTTTLSGAIAFLSGRIGDGEIPEGESLLSMLNALDTLIGDTPLPSGTTSVTDALNQIASGSIVGSVNGILPDSSGNVEVDTGVMTINGQSPDANGDAVVDTGVMTVNNEIPDDSGNVEIDTGAMRVNDIEPDEYGNVRIEKVPLADNLDSGDLQESIGSYIERTTGGEASIHDGNGWLTYIHGNSIRTGHSDESHSMTVTPAEGERQGDAITATIDWDVFRAKVENTTGDVTLTYDGSAWSDTPADYGVTVSGVPIEGDTILMVFIAETRGTITNATPTMYASTTWNVYNHNLGYARILHYSDTYGYRIDGTYTSLAFATTLDGEQSTVTPDTNGLFYLPADGYVFVTGGNSTDTAIYPTWSDWTGGTASEFVVYAESQIDISGVMGLYFPYGLCAINSVYDEINVNLGQAIQRIGRYAYSEANLITAKNAGRDYWYDENYIYQVLEYPVINRISIDGQVVAYDHGFEIVKGTTVAGQIRTFYGVSLKDKLRREVLTFSQQTLEASQKEQARTNIGAASESDLVALTGPITAAIADLNNATSTGIYSTSNSAANRPADYCVVYVWALASSTFVQIASSVLTSRMFIRQYSNGTWKSWEELALNSNIQRLKAVQSIALKANATSTSTTVNTYGGRKFSDYHTISFVLRDSNTSGNIRDCITIPSSLWTTGQIIFLVQNHGASLENRSGVQISYYSDTSFKVVTLGSASLTGYEILGYTNPL